MADQQFDFLVHAPPNELPKITAIYVWVSVGPNGNEGVCGIDGIPAVFANERLLPLAEKALASVFGGKRKKLRLVKFTGREVIKDVEI
jgi:hypothetical protein